MTAPLETCGQNAAAHREAVCETKVRRETFTGLWRWEKKAAMPKANSVSREWVKVARRRTA